MRIVIQTLAGAILLLSCSGKTLNVGSNEGFDTGPQVVTRLYQPPAVLVSDGATLFWIDFVGTGVFKVPTAGGAAERIAGNALGYPLLYVDADRVYYLAPDGIEAVSKAGGTPAQVVPASLVSVATVGQGIVYWVEQVTSVGTPQPMLQLRAAPITGGTSRTLATLPLSASWDAIAVTRSDVFLADNGNVTTVPIAGGPPTRINSTLYCQSLLGSTDGVYCAQSASLDQPPLVFLTSDGKTTEIASRTSNARSMALDATYVYWVNDVDRGGDVVGAPLKGGKPLVLAKDTRCTTVAVDGTAIYWGKSDGTIMRMPK